MSKAQSPTPGPSPVGRGAVCLAACFLGCLSTRPLYIYNKVKSYIMFRFLWICKEKDIFIDILSLKICV